MQVTIGQLNELLEINAEAKQAVMIRGPPGIGKSQEVAAFARREAEKIGRRLVEWNKISDEEKLRIYSDKEYRESVLILVDYRIAQSDPTDLKGLPNFGKDQYVEWRATLLFKTLSLEGVAAIAFFDELNLAPPSIQSAAYQIILDKCIGELALNPAVNIIAAGNREEDGSNVFPMSGALKNRFDHYELLEPDVRDWKEWAFDNGVDRDIIAYLLFQPNDLFNFNPTTKDYAWPSPRSWVFAANKYKLYKDKHPNDNSDEYINKVGVIVGSSVGQAISAKFSAFIKLKVNAKIEDYLEDVNLLATVEKKDLKYAILVGLADRYKHKPEIFDTLMQIVNALPESNAELICFFLRLLKEQNETEFISRIKNTSENRQIFLKYGKYFMK